MAKVRRWDINLLKELLQKKTKGLITSREICKRLRIKPASLHTYTSRYKSQLEIESQTGQKSANVLIELKPPLMEEQKAGSPPDWLLKGEQKFPPDVDPFCERQNNPDAKPPIGDFSEVEYPPDSAEAIEMRRGHEDKPGDKPKVWNPHWHCFMDEEIEDKNPK